MALRFIATKRNGRKAVFNNYIYTKKNANDINIYWYCVERDRLRCPGALKTLITMDGPQETKEHNHLADPRKVDVGQAIDALKTSAANGNDRPSVLRNNALVRVNENSRTEVPSLGAIRKVVQRVRGDRYPPNVAVADLQLDGIWTQTAGENPLQFLRFDNHEVGNRIIMFASPECLRQIANANSWFVDGNFGIAPPGFLQLYVLRAQSGDSAVTAAYALMERKTRGSYEALLTSVNDNCVQAGYGFPQVTAIHCDFEAALHAAVRIVLPQANIRGCFYHLTQSTWRKIQDLGLTNYYRDNEEFKLFAGMVDGLAFLPLAQIANGMAFLRNNTPDDAEELLEYFDRIYVTGERAAVAAAAPGVAVQVVRPPLFPRATWNVHQQTLDGGHRTNNLCESWNMRVKHLVGLDHPSVWKLIETIKKEDVAVTTALRLAEIGQPVHKRVRRDTLELNTRLTNLCQQYVANQRDIGQFLRGIGHNIRWGVERLQQ